MEVKRSHPAAFWSVWPIFDSEVRTFPDGERKRFGRAFGRVNWSEATVHEVQDCGAVPSHTVRIELKV
jgi:hypothetical protein